MIYDSKIETFLANDDIVSEPESFKTYSEIATGKALEPWPYISIDSIQKLRAELKQAKMMVLRLGSRPQTKGSFFSLVKARTCYSEFFFEDEKLFAALTPELFLPDVSIRSLFPFQLLPKVTETSVVNLALASGLLPHALGVEKSESLLIPATGQSVFTFEFRPREDQQVKLIHNQGQVEIDAVFVAKRDNKESLFIVEAKHGSNFDSLAKHKLLYPVLSLLPKIPASMPIIPVYLRSIKTETGIDFFIAECPAVNKDNQHILALDSLSPYRTHAYHLANY
ncbi:hypothetical protein WG68_04425 [Arsukibacterium ikkense]|uniref:DUF6997 domain-containing protein n=1 Tax=Arsukibacterium ikkense TaxID=336831 RepID=A0A0M2VBQ4_9GAMM|nr:hypothetical protein [Arsukibacterium ikkense]KKO46558.1 hypothetical protein WG68_04425 [Arsukibacterium ikkense]